MIIRCSCAHEAQDQIHGIGLRVANAMKDIEKCRCTVCGVIHRIASVLFRS